MRGLFLIILSLLFTHQAFPQKIVQYLKDNRIKVMERDSANFIREITKIDSGKFDLKEFYKSGSLKRYGKLSTYKPFLSLEGLVTSYYENGKKESEIFYVRNEPVGKSQEYYANGQLKKVTEYFKDSQRKGGGILEYPERLISYFDSLGKQQVKEGNGYYTHSTLTNTESGKYVNGFKDSIWVGEYLSEGLIYKEEYSEGLFLGGVLKNVNSGKTKKYKQIGSQPSFPGGIEKFYSFIGNNYKRPSLAIVNKVAGRVLVEFAVEKDGSLSDLEVLEDPGFGTAGEAIRVLRLSPHWISGEFRGRPVKIYYTIPIMLAAR